jgi:hypothetical protein
VVEPRIVESLAIGNEGAEDRADFKQLIPITIVASQAGGIKAENETDASQANLSEQALEATACLGSCS